MSQLGQAAPAVEVPAPPTPQYSDAYHKLVGNGIGDEEYNLVGIIAYALYKKGKIEFITTGNRSASDPEVRNYHQNLTPTNVGALKSMAKEILQLYADQLEIAYDENTKQATVNSELLRNVKGEFSSLRGHVTERTTTKAAVISGVISSLVFAVLLTVIASAQWQNPFKFMAKYVAESVDAGGKDPALPAKAASK